MSWEQLKTNYADAVFSGLRKYRTINNEDGTVSFEDVTDYEVKEESYFGAKDVNSINGAINSIMGSLGKSGNLDELQTQTKESLVAAINELANREIDVLDTAEAIKANTRSGKVAGAKGTKELFEGVSERLGGVTQFVVDNETGKITGYKTQIGGADTVFPFKSGGGLIIFSAVPIGDNSISATLPINENNLKDKETFSASANTLTCLKDGTNVHILPYGSSSGYYNVHYGAIAVTVYKNGTALSAGNLGANNVVTLNKGDTIRAVGTKKDTKAYGSAVFCIVHSE